MVVVVVNAPVKMMSLSEAAQVKVAGVEHRIERIVGLSEDRPTGKNGGKNLTDAFNVWTYCGKQIDAYPETWQGRAHCALCVNSKKPPSALILYRIMPPVPEAGSGSRWSSAYWAHHDDEGWVASLNRDRLAGDPVPRAETDRQMRPA